MAMIRRKIHKALFNLCLLGLLSAVLQAQNSPFDPEMAAQAALIREEVDGFTDRSLYITGEAISFSMRLQTSGLPDEVEWSRILYVDLISASGARQAQGKFRIQNNMAVGEFQIPEGILTGVYFLRAYTRWMRNWDPSCYVYLPLRIINPTVPELDEAIPGEPGEHSLNALSVTGGAVNISTASRTFGRGDSIGVELLHFTGGAAGSLNGCLSIVPAAAKPGVPLLAEGSDRNEGSFQLDFLPDIFGVTLSGRVLRSVEDQALEGSRVHFTLLGEQAGYVVAHADAYGRFSMSLPGREGRLELFVQPEQDGDGALEVRIDQDFDSRVLSLEAPSFSMDQQEEQALTLMARKHQLSGIYSDIQVREDPEEDRSKIPIYGTPDFRLNLDDYILLPTLEEVFINLVPDITPLSRPNRTDLTIASVNPGISLFPPLLMVDQVPIFSMEQFLSISPSEISHIDVITDVYVRGDMRFGGIINLWTREGNMAGIDLPEYSFFIDYHALTPLPGSSPGRGSSPDRLPDTRNTLLWMPGLLLERSVPRSVSFVAPDYPGDYVIIYQGWDEQGQAVSAESIISIEQ